MRTKLILAMLAATLLLPVPTARAQVGCLSRGWGLWVPNGVTCAVGNARAGKPCQIGFGEKGGIIEVIRITERPLHGVLGVADKEGNRRYVAYVPTTGFAGHDRFELHIQVIPFGQRASLTTS